MKKLYFQHSDGSFSYICDVEDGDLPVGKVLEDLAVRAPHFKSYYQRIWTDDNGWTWIDVGDYFCFYIIKEE